MNMAEGATGVPVSILTAAASNQTAGSIGVELLIDYLNSDPARQLVNKLALSDEALSDEAQRMNFWTGGNFVVKKASCTGILKKGLQLRVECLIRGIVQHREIVVHFPSVVNDEVMLKNVLVQMATQLGRLQDTGHSCAFPMLYHIVLSYHHCRGHHAAPIRPGRLDAAGLQVQQRSSPGVGALLFIRW